MKIQIGFHAGMELGRHSSLACYQFTAKIRPDVLRRWYRSKSLMVDLIRRRLNAELKQLGHEHVAYGFVIESVSKRGRARVDPHLHGYLVPSSLYAVTAFKVALEQVVLDGDLSKPSRGEWIQIKPAYDDTQDGRWVNYIMKGMARYDARIGRRRVYTSTPLIQGAREAWGIWRDDRVTR